MGIVVKRILNFRGNILLGDINGIPEKLRRKVVIINVTFKTLVFD